MIDAGLILKVNRIEKPEQPLNVYTDDDAFKLFLVDIGLLNAIADLDPKILLNKNAILIEYKGVLTEQFVCQQLKIKKAVYYWTAENATAEIDFMIQYQHQIIPIEVKAEENLKAKSLKVYTDKYNPQTAVRTSMNMFREEEWLVNIPLHAIGGIV